MKSALIVVNIAVAGTISYRFKRAVYILAGISGNGGVAIREKKLVKSSN